MATGRGRSSRCGVRDERRDAAAQLRELGVTSSARLWTVRPGSAKLTCGQLATP